MFTDLLPTQLTQNKHKPAEFQRIYTKEIHD